MKNNQEKFQERYALFLLRRKWWVLSFTLLLTLFFAWHAKNVVTINALENMLPEHDPDLQRYNQLIKDYGGDFIMMIAIEAKEIFTFDMLRGIDILTRELEKLESVKNVISLTNIPYLKAEKGKISILPLADQFPKNADEITSFRDFILSDDFYTRFLVLKDEPVTVIYAQLKPEANLLEKQRVRDAFVPQVREMLAKQQEITPFTYHLAGRVPLEYQLDKSARENQTLTTFLLLGMISLILFFLFRSFAGIVLCIMTIGLSSL